MVRGFRKALKADMYELLEQWKKSDKSTVDFCKEHNLVKSSLYYWHKKLKNEKQKQVVEKIKQQFIPIKISNEYLNQSIEILYPNGVKVLLSEKIDKQTIHTLIHLY